MMTKIKTHIRSCLGLVAAGVLLSGSFLVTGCSVNPATGERQFTALMSPAQEVQVGAQEHEKIVAQFGLYDNAEITRYVQDIGQRIAANTERADVQYQFFVLDTPMVNAFALPGGYIYLTRGLMALANSEAEMAAVIAHEIGHVTGRHSAERYSQSVLASLGTAALSAAIDKGGVSQALGLGSNLYIKSYSRAQENEADTLGLRYLNRAGYDVSAMASFLTALEAHSIVDARSKGQNKMPVSYFSTHPATADRVAKTISEAGAFQAGGKIAREEYLNLIDGMIYGDSPRHGFVRGHSFIHPDIGFTFDVPDDFRIENQPTQVVALHKSGAVVVFDMIGNPKGIDPYSYLTQGWMRGEQLSGAEQITINGMPAATAAMAGRVNGQPVTIRLVAVKWKTGSIMRFQIAIPQGTSVQMVEDLKRTTYSLRALTNAEIADARPKRLDVFTAKSGDSVATLARRLPYSNLQEERFRALNGMGPSEELKAGRLYKTVAQP